MLDGRYIERMERSISNKNVLMDYANRLLGLVMDVGASTGLLSRGLIDDLGYEGRVLALEPDKETYNRLVLNCLGYDKIECINGLLNKDILESQGEPLNVILCSVLHEVYSYNKEWSLDLDERKEIFKSNLRDMFGLLEKGSRIILRDGVAPTNRDELLYFRFRDKDKYDLGLDFYNLFREKFEFKDELDFNEKELRVKGKCWLIIEMLLTITWGRGSLWRESQEYFTVMHIDDYRELFSSVGYKELYGERFIQDGYEYYLSKLGRLEDMNNFPRAYPFTTQILVMDKV